MVEKKNVRFLGLFHDPSARQMTFAWARCTWPWRSRERLLKREEKNNRNFSLLSAIFLSPQGKKASTLRLVFISEAGSFSFCLPAG